MFICSVQNVKNRRLQDVAGATGRWKGVRIASDGTVTFGQPTLHRSLLHSRLGFLYPEERDERSADDWEIRNAVRSSLHCRRRAATRWGDAAPTDLLGPVGASPAER